IVLLLAANLREAFLNFPRHKFLPEEVPEELAWQDKSLGMYEIEIPGAGICRITQSQPTFVLEMLAHLSLNDGLGSILEIGCGTGWVMSMLSRFTDHVYGSDVFSDICNLCNENLALHNIKSAEAHCVEFGTVGIPQYAPYDRIIANCGMNFLDLHRVISQLAPKGIAVVPIRVLSITLEEVLRMNPELIGIAAIPNRDLCVLHKITRFDTDEVRVERITTCTFVPFL
ncbi:MAG: methyltransferase domain-containing protein, partial [Patescibacteria group bacterium]|nr:methyltransferase domain-containing protein [Patescibacteria group bacterium]